MSKTTFAQDMDSHLTDNMRYDMSCKRLLSQKIILAWILQGCVPEYQDIPVQTIAETYIEGNPIISGIPVMPEMTNTTEKIQGLSTEDPSINEGTITYDIRFMSLVPKTKEPISLIINIEAQNDFYPGYPLIKRGIYYCSRMISSQFGTVFSHAEYGKIKKVYSIWLCLNPSTTIKNSIVRYAMKEEILCGNFTNKPQNYDLLSVIMVCLSEPEPTRDVTFLNLLNSLFSDSLTSHEKKQILSETFHIPMTYDLEQEVDSMCNLSAGLGRRYMEKGMTQGKAEAIIALMNSMNMTATEVMDKMAIPQNQRSQYMQLLKDLKK